MSATRKATLGFYWVTTEDRYEDWFVLAHTGRSAAIFHEQYDGYARGDAKAERLFRGIEPNGGDVPRHAHLPDLEALGFTILQCLPTRIVQLGQRIFSESAMRETIEAFQHAEAYERLRQAEGGERRTTRGRSPSPRG